MTARQGIEAPCEWQILAAKAVYRERMAMGVASIAVAAAAFKDAVLAFADEPSPQNAGRYLAASERLTVLGRELETSGASRAVVLPAPRSGGRDEIVHRYALDAPTLNPGH